MSDFNTLAGLDLDQAIEGSEIINVEKRRINWVFRVLIAMVEETAAKRIGKFHHLFSMEIHAYDAKLIVRTGRRGLNLNISARSFPQLHTLDLETGGADKIPLPLIHAFNRSLPELVARLSMDFPEIAERVRFFKSVAEVSTDGDKHDADRQGFA